MLFVLDYRSYPFRSIEMLDVTKWNTFWDSFQVAVHRNEGISNIDKFNYLNYVLEGVAARAIPGLTLTEANYDAAVKLLQERCDLPQ